MAVFDADHRADSLSARIALTFIESGQAALNSRTYLARQHDLPTLQASLLIELRGLEGNGGTVGALAGSLQLTPPTISDSLKALVRKGYITRHKSEEDGRVAFFRLTARGKRTAEKLMAWADPIEEVIASLDKDEQLSLLGTLTHLLWKQVEFGHHPSACMCVSCTFFEPVSWEKKEFFCRLRNETITLPELCTDCPNHILEEEVD